EQDNLAKGAREHMRNKGNSWDIPDREVPMKVFMCPSDREKGKNQTGTTIFGLANIEDQPEVSQGFHGNYVMCAGSTYFNPTDDRLGTKLDGMFYPFSQTKVRDVKDGMSNTIMAGELLLVPDYLSPTIMTDSH